jgi:hypothetical protein
VRRIYHGDGVLTMADESSYTGKFNNGIKQGKFLVKDTEGSYKRITYVNDEPVSYLDVQSGNLSSFYPYVNYSPSCLPIQPDSEASDLSDIDN